MERRCQGPIQQALECSIDLHATASVNSSSGDFEQLEEHTGGWSHHLPLLEGRMRGSIPPGSKCAAERNGHPALRRHLQLDTMLLPVRRPFRPGSKGLAYGQLLEVDERRQQLARLRGIVSEPAECLNQYPDVTAHALTKGLSDLMPWLCVAPGDTDG